MRALRSGLCANALVLAACLLRSLPAGAADESPKPITIELNKLAPNGKGCRLYFVTDNPSPSPIQSLKLDLVFFGIDGVIAQRLAVEFGPLAAAKKRVKGFDLESPTCDDIGSVLLNDVDACRSPTAPIADCLQHLAVSSRARAPFTK